MKTKTLYTNFTELLRWALRFHMGRNLAYTLIGASLLSGIATYGAITNSTSPFGPDPHTVTWLVLLNLICFSSLAILITRRLFNLWAKRKREFSSNRLQSKIVLMFSLVASVPTIIVIIFSTLFFNFGIQSWFNERISTALNGSISIAEAYLNEHRELIRSDIMIITNEINGNVMHNLSRPDFLKEELSNQVHIHNLTEAMIFNRTGILASSGVNYIFSYDLIPQVAFDQADQGKVVILHNNRKDIVRALVKLQGYHDEYLMVGRFVADSVLKHIDATNGAAAEYKRLKSQISKLQINFSIIFLLVALMLLLSAIWLGIMFASEIAKPIGRLVKATQKLKDGDFSVRLEESKKDDEINMLAKAFNLMTEQIQKQRNDLIAANSEIDVKRQFSESVLAGVSASVIALNPNKTITLLNKSALSFFGEKRAKLVDKNLLELLPEFAELFEENENKNLLNQKEISLNKDGKRRILMARVVTEFNRNKLVGYVVTFDDITDLVIAQRTAAWSDIARRIAHEIKNPLTPIILASERLNSKFSKEVSDPENFSKYTDTIKRHVGDIGKMVEEFVNFAKMQVPAYEKVDVCKIVKDAVFLQQCGSTKIKYNIEIPDKEIILNIDPRQINQILINILKNAQESLEFYMIEKHNEKYSPEIKVVVVRNKKICTISVSDNGKGFGDNVEKLIEPYVTTKPKGTGLGLSIVKKIADDHGAVLDLSNGENGGAIVSIRFPCVN